MLKGEPLVKCWISHRGLSTSHKTEPLCIAYTCCAIECNDINKECSPSLGLNIGKGHRIESLLRLRIYVLDLTRSIEPHYITPAFPPDHFKYKAQHRLVTMCAGLHIIQ